MKNEKSTQEICTTDLRKTLKNLMQKEVENIPEILGKLEPEQRLNMLIKLMPFVFPKVSEVRHEQGEASEFEINNWK
jgi:hypothetical protein